MNKYVQAAMESKEGLPKTFEEYQLMHPVHSKLVPMSHVQMLRDEFDKKNNSGGSTMKPIVF